MSVNQNHVTLPGFDRTALRVNQAAMIVLLLAAFVANMPWLAATTAIIMALGAISPSLALFQRLYRDVLRPAGLLRPDIHQEDAAPHRFAQGMGATVLILASLALFLGAPTVGWALALLVVALAAINLVFGFCVGCFIFFQIQRLAHSR
ncbi:DUF4395 domain-containing protein [Roseiflexus sp. RS-1]|jgi:hypothetical protein|uniref:DUF4395 domain-containing protein n=1 Tax=Roseiflexus sp. (strain RS-1) TaxID=357808 RepID=UPI0000D81481|nr:DUF4395 domain-containing protein [Roseiflexus sp. RS-1]ABQ92911.1 hypothetical protein RoseRS_4580 [Roseiflexus sp. RS-1]MBO9321517.1 DUF4395 domain-containing protein [Roseiflexus sp.]